MTLQPEGYFPGPPDLAIEVLSPSDSARDVQTKIGDWLQAGCRAVLVLDPARSAGEVHRPAGQESFSSGDEVRIDDVVPGWRIDLADLFR
jgi:Uma2 family endonuclease